MAMGIQQQNHHPQGSPPIFPSDFDHYAGQYDTNDRQPRDTGRNINNGNGRYRRPRSPSLDDDSRFTTGAPSEHTNSEAALHDAVLAQAAHQQQRVVPTAQPGVRTQARAAGPRSGPPSMANASQNRRSYPQPPPVNSQLPPYASNPEDDWSPASRAAAAAAGGAGAGAGGYSRRRTERHARRQSSTSGAPTASDPALQMSGGAASSSSPRIANNNGDHPPQRQPSNPAGLRPPSPPTAGMNLGLAGDEISRLQSPSISKSVLEPLQRKMLEYHNLMEEAQGQMTQLDAELRALQERRRQAEQRFVDAKGKHDEYERQHLDVEKALRGDYAPIAIPQQQQMQQMQQQMPPQGSQQQHQMYNDSPPRTLGRPASSIMSYDERPMSGRSSMQGKKGKFRISLFGR